MINMFKKDDRIVATFGGRLRCLREEMEITQVELAKLLHLKSSATISQYENDELNRIPDAHTLQRLADILHCSVDYLLCRTENRNPDFNEVEFINIDGDMITKEEAIKYVRIARQVEKITKEVKWKPEKD